MIIENDLRNANGSGKPAALPVSSEKTTKTKTTNE
jgi:hypothetical protein